MRLPRRVDARNNTITGDLQPFDPRATIYPQIRIDEVQRLDDLQPGEVYLKAAAFEYKSPVVRLTRALYVLVAVGAVGWILWGLSL